MKKISKILPAEKFLIRLFLSVRVLLLNLVPKIKEFCKKNKILMLSHLSQMAQNSNLIQAITNQLLNNSPKRLILVRKEAESQRLKPLLKMMKIVS